MGGDFAPNEALKGAAEYLAENNKAHVVLIGDEERLNPLLSKMILPQGNYSVVHAP